MTILHIWAIQHWWLINLCISTCFHLWKCIYFHYIALSFSVSLSVCVCCVYVSLSQTSLTATPLPGCPGMTSPRSSTATQRGTWQDTSYSAGTSLRYTNSSSMVQELSCATSAQYFGKVIDSDDFTCKCAQSKQNDACFCAHTKQGK